MANTDRICAALARIARRLARREKARLDALKANYNDLARPDFLWHYLLQSFATMLRADGWHGLIGNQANYNRLKYEVLSALSPAARTRQVKNTCRVAKIRMAPKKAGYILGCFSTITKLGGPKAAKAHLLALPGRDAKIRFLKTLPGIGEKYARNIMMDVYHEDFRDSIAVDARIKTLSRSLGLSFPNYAQHEAFYLRVAQDAGLNGWELDRLMFHFQSEFLEATSQ